MFYTPVLHMSGTPMTDQPRKKLRLRAAAKHVGLDPSYLSRIAKTDRLRDEGVTIIRNSEYPDVVEFYEDEIEQWYNTYHTKRARKKS
jgi:hypothetical protein